MANVLLLVSYLIGSLSFSIIVVRAIADEDVREKGSGNAGATNVLRNYGLKTAVVVAILDIAKGVAAVLLMKTATANPAYLGAAAVLVILGHIFPVFFRFRGGKGVATTIGAFLALSPAAALVVMAIFVATVAVSRYVSLGSIVASVALAPISHFVFHAPDPFVLAQGAAAILIVAKHVDNLRRLASGTERKLGQK
jgi:glycerol-3-phosphate acyltransferase PlsY